MSDEIKMHDVVTFMQDVRTMHFVGSQPLLLHRGPIGAVVMSYQDAACEVEFADRNRRAFAILPLRPHQLMVLHDTPDFVPA